MASRIPDIRQKTIIQGEKVAKSCSTCMLVASHPPIPMEGHRGASHFGEIVVLDLSFVDDLCCPALC